MAKTRTINRSNPEELACLFKGVIAFLAGGSIGGAQRLKEPEADLVARGSPADHLVEPRSPVHQDHRPSVRLPDEAREGDEAPGRPVMAVGFRVLPRRTLRSSYILIPRITNEMLRSTDYKGVNVVEEEEAEIFRLISGYPNIY